MKTIDKINKCGRAVYEIRANGTTLYRIEKTRRFYTVFVFNIRMMQYIPIEIYKTLKQAKKALL